MLVCGLNYHRTPLHIREKFVIPDICLEHALHALAQFPHVQEAVLLSTCNRTEVYAVVTDLRAGMQEIESFFLSTQAISDHEKLKPNFRLLRDDVVLHLFRVASGLDSLILGEGQILHQVRNAFKAACTAGTTGVILEQLFKLALNCGKRVRSETSMSRRAVSVSSAAVELGREVVGELANKSVVIIGAGRMGQICAKHILAESGTGPVVMINRTAAKVEQFAGNKLGCASRLHTGLSFAERHELAGQADLVIVATSAYQPILQAAHLRAVRTDKPLCIVDISVPRNVQPEVAGLEGVSLYYADDLCRIVDRNKQERAALSVEAEAIVLENMDEFHAWQCAYTVAPTISDLRRKIEAIRVEHVARSECLSTNRAELEEISRTLVNHILHHPTVKLKSTNDQRLLKEQAETLRRLFALDTVCQEQPLPEESLPALTPQTQVAAFSNRRAGVENN